jgi:hypothetical protein
MSAITLESLHTEMQGLKETLNTALQAIAALTTRLARKPLSDFAIACFRCQKEVYINFCHIKPVGPDMTIQCPACGMELERRRTDDAAALLESHRVKPLH